jgi:carbohydrate-selective porin OprB
MLVSSLAYSQTLNMEATCSFETPADFQRTTRRYTPQDVTLHNRRCENRESYMNYNSWFVGNITTFPELQ